MESCDLLSTCARSLQAPRTLYTQPAVSIRCQSPPITTLSGSGCASRNCGRRATARNVCIRAEGTCRAGTTAWTPTHVHARATRGPIRPETMRKQMPYRVSSVRRIDDNKDARASSRSSRQSSGGAIVRTSRNHQGHPTVEKERAFFV
jgi:hypothetical protein